AEIKVSNGKLRIQLRASYENASVANGKKVEVDNVIAFNLTKFFGKGNEPTKEAFEKMLSVIDVKEGKTNIAQTQKAITQYILSVTPRNEKPICVITFDDGNLSDYELAFPFLQARGIRATSYI